MAEFHPVSYDMNIAVEFIALYECLFYDITHPGREHQQGYFIEVQQF